MSTLAARLDRAIRSAGVAITGVSIGSDADRATWRVQPPDLQAAAQPTIDAFNPNDPAHVTAEKDAEIDGLKAIRALAEATFELKTTAFTKAAFLQRVKAIYRGL